jgi:putative ATPase
MSDLFSSGGAGRAETPLADRMRPETIDDVIGQDHIVGEGRLLRRAIQRDRLSSVIFYGPPGTGKTSLARVIANSTKATFESLNAVLAGIKDIREAIDRAGERRKFYDKRTILFVDEVHRWNKAQQDALLPWVENGTVILIGATTENPFFEVNRALVSRSRVFQLKALTPEDLILAAQRAVSDPVRGYGAWRVVFDAGALEHVVEVSSGDARSLLNALELAVETSPPVWPPPPGSEIRVSLTAAEESIQRRAVLYDKDGDYHFDTISAFIKSVRGSDPDAALYWLAKMVAAGEDPAFIFRRMIILASEDVGMADPHALAVVISCAESFDRIGFPEGNFPLAHACIYLATAPKSNSAMGYFDAASQVAKEDAEVPNHLRDPSRDKESFGHGEGYVYPHAYREHWTAQQYLPSVLQGKLFYTPSSIGYEGTIRDEVLRKREVQAAVLMEEAAARDRGLPGDGEALTWQMEKRGAEGWYRRLQSGRSAVMLEDRDAMLEAAAIRRHDRVLIARADDGLLLWESFRRVPEGLACGIVGNAAAQETLLRYAASLEGDEKPVVGTLGGLPAKASPSSSALPSKEEAKTLFGTGVFDHILAREPWRGDKDPRTAFARFAEGARELLADGGSVVVLQSPPGMGQRLSAFIGDEGLAARLAAAENAFFKGKDPPCPGEGAPSLEDNVPPDVSRWSWTAEDVAAAFAAAGFSPTATVIDHREERIIGETDLAHWFDPAKSPWGTFIHETLGEADFADVKARISGQAQSGPLAWRWRSVLVKATVSLPA